MSAMTEGMKGPRLEFVVRPVKGKHVIEKHSFNDKTKTIETTKVSVDADYLVYLPNGNSYRLNKQQLVKRKFDRQPTILNFDKISDTKTPAGRYKFAMDDATRRKAWIELENEVIRACERRHGPVIQSNGKDKENDSASA